MAVALLLGGCARAREPSNPDAAPTPPPTFLEAEPGEVDSPGLDHSSITIANGLVASMHAEPMLLAEGGWGFQLELEFHNQLDQGVFDLGPEPVIVFTISVTLPDGTGFGSGGGCAFGSSLHGHQDQALRPGERRVVRDSWMAGVDEEQVLEAGIFLCSIRLPDGRTLGGTIAQIDAVVDAEGKLAKFELRALAVPQPRP